MDQIEELKNHISELEHNLNNAKQVAGSAMELMYSIRKSEEDILKAAVERVNQLPYYKRQFDNITDAIMGPYAHE